MDKAIMAAKERQEYITQDKEERDIYFRRQMAVMDYNSGISSAREEGLEQGMVRGLERGRAEGQDQGRTAEKLVIARNLLAEGSTPEFVQKITGLSLDEIAKL